MQRALKLLCFLLRSPSGPHFTPGWLLGSAQGNNYLWAIVDLKRLVETSEEGLEFSEKLRWKGESGRKGERDTCVDIL